MSHLIRQLRFITNLDDLSLYHAGCLFRLIMRLPCIIIMDNPLFYSANFDPIAYLNERFPNEASLSNLDTQIDTLNKQLQDVNAELIKQIHEHAMMNIHVSEEIQKARQLSKEVIKQIGIIKEKTTKSEEIVYEMCKDLKSLDIAKRNLTFSIDALKKFIMMVDALEKLRDACEKRRYKEVANLISAFNQLSNYFKKYENIPQIQDLYKEKNAIIVELISQITEDFEAFDKKSSLLKAQDLRYACQVIEVLGEKYHRKFIQSICQIILQPYKDIYSQPENKVLENTERRYGWIKRKMQDFNNSFAGVFPEEWGVNCHILYQFCSITCLHLTQILERTSNQNVNVAILMKSLQVTLKFQERITSEMEQRYKHILSQTKPMSYKITSLPKFVSSISHSFQKHLVPYIKSEQQAMYQALDKNLAEDTLTEIKVYNSSVVLFHSIKSVLGRVKQYSRGSLVINILRVIKDILKYYRDKCLEKIKKAANYEQTVCYIINTGEHCKNIISGLEEKVDSMLDPKYRVQIKFDEEDTLFTELISKAIDNFVNYLHNKLETIFQVIPKVQWEKREQDIMESDYVRRAKALIAAHFSSIKDQMNHSDLAYYLNKMVVELNNRFMANVYKCKKLPQNAYQFLKMDLGELKEELIKMVKDEKEIFNSAKVLESYRSFISKTFAKSENFITLLQLPLANIAERFDTFIENGKLEDLDRILQIKGYKRSDVPNLVRILEKRQ